jgi:hypothetical protein
MLVDLVVTWPSQGVGYVTLVHEKIKKTISTLDCLSYSSFHLHLKLTRMMNTILWRTVDSIVALKVDKEGHTTCDIHERKLNQLLIKHNANEDNNEAKKVVNLSSHIMESIELSVLRKGLKFALATRSISVDIILCNIKDIIQPLANEDKESIRQDCVVILRRSKPPKSNINKKEHIVLKNLRSNTKLVILRVDKGGDTVIMNHDDYNRK